MSDKITTDKLWEGLKLAVDFCKDTAKKIDKKDFIQKGESDKWAEWFDDLGGWSGVAGIFGERLQSVLDAREALEAEMRGVWKPISELPPLNRMVVGLVREYEINSYILFSTHDMGNGEIVFSADEITVSFNRDGTRADYKQWTNPLKINARLIAWYPIQKSSLSLTVESVQETPDENPDP